MFAPPVLKAKTAPCAGRGFRAPELAPAGEHVSQSSCEGPVRRPTSDGASWAFSDVANLSPERARPDRLTAPGTASVLPKLTLGRLDDPLEHEADRVADKVMRTPVATRPASAGGSNAGGGANTAASHVAAPAAVKDALATPGEAINDEARSFFEPRFGRDFSGVRIHADATAAKSAAAIGARAYTAGSHIVFGSSQYAPTSRAGRNLLAHELAHVVQAGRSTTGDALVRRAPGDAMKFDTGGLRFNAPAAGATVASVMAEVKAKQDQKPDPDLGSKVDVTGVAVGKPEEIFVWRALLDRSLRQFWGTQVQVVTAIGPPPAKPPGAAAPLGQVIIKIDGQGNASAELVAQGAVGAPAAFADAPTAVAALKTDFGFASVDDGTATWTPADLNKVHAALKRLPAPDIAALTGVSLVRDSTLTSPEGKPLSGQFRHEASVTTGSASTAAVASRSASLHIANSAFDNDAISFVGGKGATAVGSFATILHETGHAVETKALRDAQFATFEAQATSNNDTLAFNTEQTSTNTAVRAANAAHSAAINKFRAYPAAGKTSAEAFVTAFNAALGAVNAYANNQTGSRFATLEPAAVKAIAKRDAELAKLPAAHPASADFAAALQTQNAWFQQARVRATASLKLDASKAELATKKKSEAGVSGATPGTSKRLANFVDLVKASKIKPLTQYAKDNWPGHPEEFYAEAYSLWLTSPAFLTDNAPDLKAWFDAGGHLR